MDIVKMAIKNMIVARYTQNTINNLRSTGKLYTKEIENFSTMDFKRIRVINSILLIALYKEDIVENKKISKSTDEIFSFLLSDISQEENSEYKLGDMTFDNKINLLNLVRNKLLHGGFIFDDENEEIIINNRGLNARIKYDDLIYLGFKLTASETVQASGIVERKAYIINSKKILKLPSRKYATKFERVGEYCYEVSIKEEPEDGYERNFDYMRCIENFMDDLGKLQSSSFDPERQMRYLYNRYKNKFEKNHIKISYELKKATEMDVFEETKQIFNFHAEQFNKFFPQYNRNMSFAFEWLLASEKADDKLRLENGLIAYNKLLNCLSVNEIDGMFHTKVLFADQIIVASLSSFYCIYQFGLESFYSKGKNTSLKDVMYCCSFPFEKLDLSNFIDPNMTIKDDFSRFHDEYREFENDMMNARKAYDDKLNEIKNMLQSNVNEVSILEEQKELEKLEKAYKIAEKFYKLATLFMNEYFDKFVLNYNILHHIRNSLSHGNIKVDKIPVGDYLLDRKITITDVHKGNVTYKKEITYKEFEQIINYENFNNIVSYLCTVYGIDYRELFEESKIKKI